MFSKSSFASATRLRQSGLILKGGGGTSFSSFCQFSKYLFYVCAVFLILCGTAMAAAPAQIEVNQDYFSLYVLGSSGKFTDMEADYILIEDVDLENVLKANDWKPIGNESNPFNGTFKGNGFTISNLSIDSVKNDVGLFGHVNNAEFSDISLKDSFVKGNDWVGTLVGNVTGTAKFENCSVLNGKVNGGTSVGGLVGHLASGDIINSSASCTVSSSYCAGGLVGFINSGNITGSSAFGNVTANQYESGGLAGRFGLQDKDVSGGNITDSSASCTVKASNYAGGLVGNLSCGNISNSSAFGTITATENYAGGLAGYMIHSSITDSSAFGTVKATKDYAGGLVGSFGYSSVQPESIKYSFSECEVSAKNYAGGLAGNFSGPIVQSYALGKITAAENYAGGLVGYSYLTLINDSYANNEVEAKDYAGGLVGYNSNEYYDGISRYINESYFSGSVSLTSVSENIGGLVGGGGDKISDVSNSFYLEKPEYKTTQGIPVPDEDMKKLSTYTGWDIDSVANTDHIWYITEGFTYPQFLTATPIMVNQVYFDAYVAGSSSRFSDMKAKYILTENVDLKKALENNDWKPIGTPTNMFKGVFEGNGFTISNLSINSDESPVGLFSWVLSAEFYNISFKDSSVISTGDYVGTLTGRITKSSIIENCSVFNGTIKGKNSVGGLVGWMGSHIESSTEPSIDCSNCFVNVDVTAGGDSAGGLVGLMSYGNVINSSALGTVKAGTDNAGGLVGKSNWSSIENSFSECMVDAGNNNAGGLVGDYAGSSISQSYASGDITAVKDNAGGLVGSFNSEGSEISNSYSNAGVKAGNRAGGLMGLYRSNFGIGSCSILNSYSSSSITLTGGGTEIGSLVGFIEAGSADKLSVTHSFYLDDGTTYVLTNGTATSDKDMKKLNTFKDAGWDIVPVENIDHIWYITEDETYPLFSVTVIESPEPPEPPEPPVKTGNSGGGSSTGHAKIITNTESSGSKDDVIRDSSATPDAVQQQDNTQKKDDAQKQDAGLNSNANTNTGFGSDIGNSKWFYFFSGVVFSAVIGSLAFFLNRRK